MLLNMVLRLPQIERRAQMDRDNSVSVRPLWTRCIASELGKAGANMKEALAESGLSWRSLNNVDAWIPFVGHARLFEFAARELRNDLYGMELAERVHVRDGD